jgi:hypothetical protein
MQDDLEIDDCTNALSSINGFRYQTLWVVEKCCSDRQAIKFREEGIDDVDIFYPDEIRSYQVKFKPKKAISIR